MTRRPRRHAACLSATVTDATAQNAADQVQQLESEVGKLNDELVNERSKLLRTLKVNGKELDPLEVMRECVYLAGGKLVEAKVANFFILEEIMKQVNSGQRKADDFLVSEKEVLDNLAPMKKEFEAKNPGIDFWEVVRTQYGSAQDLHGAAQGVDPVRPRVLPGAPRIGRRSPREAIKAQTQSEQGHEFMAQLEKATEGFDENGNPKQLPELGQHDASVRPEGRATGATSATPRTTAVRRCCGSMTCEWGTEEAFDFVKKGCSCTTSSAPCKRSPSASAPPRADLEGRLRLQR